tara:strand:- start:769 stop:1638 length:870 start_codon:yes stop_codon:yes gene_type:complete
MLNNFKKKIVLGTVSLGTKYGVTNFSKKKNENQQIKILEFAWKNNIRTFDTAPGYNTEKILGKLVKKNNLEKEISIFTKIPHFDFDRSWNERVKKSIESSFSNCSTNNIDIFFFHQPKDIKDVLKKRKFLDDLKKIFPIKKFGFSIYNLNEYNDLKNDNFFDCIQIPYSIANREFEEVIIKNKNKKFHVRSIFLQGILLSKKSNILLKDKMLKKTQIYYHNFIKKDNISPTDLSMSFVSRNKKIKSIIIGVDTLIQLKELLNFEDKHSKYNFDNLTSIFKNCNLDPRKW